MKLEFGEVLRLLTWHLELKMMEANEKRKREERELNANDIFTWRDLWMQHKAFVLFLNFFFFFFPFLHPLELAHDSDPLGYNN